MGWLRLVGSIKLQVSFAKYSLFYRGLLQKETYDLIDPTNISHPVCTCVQWKTCIAICAHIVLEHITDASFIWLFCKRDLSFCKRDLCCDWCHLQLILLCYDTHTHRCVCVCVYVFVSVCLCVCVCVWVCDLPALIKTCMHTHTCTHTRAFARRCTLTRKTNVYTNTRTRSYTHTQTHTHKHTHVCIQTHFYTRTHTHIHTYTHTHIHTRTHTCTTAA